MHVNDLLKVAVEKGASDLHLKVGSYPMVRVHGRLTRVTEEKQLDHEDLVEMAASIMSATQRQKFKDAQEIDLAYSVPGPRPLPLQRVPAARHHRHGAPRHSVQGQEHRRAGAAAGPQEDRRGRARPGAGHRHHRLAARARRWPAMIDHINNTRSSHIITIEDPIEYLHRDNECDHQPARDRRRHAVVRLRAAQRAAPGPGRHPGRRNARHGDDRDGAARRRNRPPGVLDAAHPRRHGNHQPHHLGVPAAPAEADPPAAGGRC